MKAIRAPIVAVLGHVDHGKTTLLDTIRNTAVTKQEAGRITQSIGSSLVPSEIIRNLIKKYSSVINVDLKIPGLLFIDTPGHEAFTNLRRRGGALADISIVVIDINEGLKPQTIESINILRSFKTPFVIAANKIDLIYGYNKKSDFILKDIEQQSDDWKQQFYSKLYSLVGQIYDNFKMDSELFSKANFEKQIAIVPISAKEGIGVSELLILIAGLVQKYLEKRLFIDPGSSGRGVVLEVKEVKGLGHVLDTILYDGVIRVNDKILGLDLNGNIVEGYVRSILVPEGVKDIRDKKTKFISIKEATAARGIRIVAPGAESIVAGSEIYVIKSEEEKSNIVSQLKKEVSSITFESEMEGVIVKADSLGSLEAILSLLKQNNIPVRSASLGNITKKDISEAKSLVTSNPLLAVIIGFNVKVEEAIRNEIPEDVGVITGNVIYEIIDKLKEWQEEKKKDIEKKILNELPALTKIYMLPNYVFRQSNPAIFGVEILKGKLVVKTPLMRYTDGKEIGEVKEIQLNKESIHEAEKGKKVAISMPGVIVGRHIKEGDYLFTSLSEDQYRKYKELLKYLSEEEKEILREIASIKRKTSQLWGI